MSDLEITDKEQAKLRNIADAQELYCEAESYALLLPDSEDETTELDDSWSYVPMNTVNPAYEDEWQKDRLWMMDHMDPMLGADAMPALCSNCHGVFWGDEMMSIRATVSRLREGHSRTINGLLGATWEGTADYTIRQLCENRICKKCYKLVIEVRSNPWHSRDQGYNVHSGGVQHTQIQQIPFSFPNMGDEVCVSSGLSPQAQPDWTVDFTTTDQSDF